MKITKSQLRQLIKEFISHSHEPVPGDRIVNTNPGCDHYKSKGKVLDIKDLDDGMGKVIMYQVSNDGDNYNQGDILTKTMDQLDLDIHLVPDNLGDLAPEEAYGSRHEMEADADPWSVVDSYFPADVDPIEDAWSGGDNLEDDLDHAKFETGESNAGPHASVSFANRKLKREGLRRIIQEELSKSDMDRIKSAARKETKDGIKDLKSDLSDLIKKELKGKDHEDRIEEIVTNVILSLYKTLWIKRSFWMDTLSRRKTG